MGVCVSACEGAAWGYVRAEEGLGRSQVAPNVPRDRLIMGETSCWQTAVHTHGGRVPDVILSPSSVLTNCNSNDETYQEAQSYSVMTWAADTGFIYFQRLSHLINSISVLECFILYRKYCALFFESETLCGYIYQKRKSCINKTP